ncbi:uncharacterized protein I303_108539 [Kwoniella dejecticola CBS 10117]|uniref:WD40 repeat-like protein n=1 Tax=Kwoniella dejecticola CBS 10117 TaxID=1296121 RepID=A0AAJ8MLX9_9TREE
MQLGRYSVSTLRPAPIHSITFSQDGRVFAVAGEEGYEVWKSFPLCLVKRRVLPGTLTLALLLPNSPLLVLQGGGANPLYPPNKAVVFHDKLGIPVAEVEFGERIRGIKARNGLFCVALSRKVVAFQYGAFHIEKLGEWETAKNELGLMALSTAGGSSLLALPGRQAGHVQLISLPPCPPVSSSSNPGDTAFRSPIILAHTHPLSTLSTTANGSHILTTSERGTLIRVWDTTRGRLERELRRGVDKAEMWGCDFESGGGGGGGGGGKSRVVGWSDKGTIHVWKDDNPGNKDRDHGRSSTPTPSTQTLTNILSRNLPLPKYFSSSPSTAQYHLPRKNPHAISTALGKAGVNVPSMRAEEGDEESEMFVVAWVDVPTTLNPGEPVKKKGKEELKVGRRSSASYDTTSMATTAVSPSIGMGIRDERRSFGSGSDNTSRTVTPVPHIPHTVPPSDKRNSIHRNVSNNFINKSSIQDIHTTAKSSSAKTHTSRASINTVLDTDRSAAEVQVEKQLIVVTYSGDWYRLRIPDNNLDTYDTSAEGDSAGGAETEDRRGQSRKCELVEYRRLGVGGGGW